MMNSSVIRMLLPMRTIIRESESLLDGILKQKYHLTLPDFNVIMPASALTNCTQADVARFNQISEAAVSKRVATLVTRGYITRKALSAPSKRSVLTVTKEGQQVLDEVLNDITIKLESLFAPLPETDRELATKLLEAMMPIVLKDSPRREAFACSRHPLLVQLQKKMP